MKELRNFIKKHDMGFCFLAVLLILCITIILTSKIGDAREVPKMVEKDGYCKIIFGKDWDYDEEKTFCYDEKKDFKKENPKYFTEEEFRKLCPKIKWYELKFFSDCFKNADSRIN